MLELGKVHTWDEIVENYPDMYAFFTDAVKDGEEIITCKLLDVVPFEKEEETCIKYIDSGIHFGCRRTTAPVGNFIFITPNLF